MRWPSASIEPSSRAAVAEDMLENRGFVDYARATEAVNRAIANYNILRPHGSCDYYTPAQAHQMEGELRRRWRKRKPGNREKVQSQGSIFVTPNQC